MAINEGKFSITKENIISFVANLIHVPCFRLGRVTTELWWKLEKSELGVIWLKAEFLPWFLLISLTLRRPEGLFWARKFWRPSQENNSKETKKSFLKIDNFAIDQAWYRGSRPNEFRNLSTVESPNSHIQNSRTYPNSHPFFGLTKMWRFGDTTVL